ncbi:hypothetical protein NQ315_006666 [Exocentrus adspersus]|uniref:Mitogen-activated protein kinase 15 n=1 Tax=Exocentrus adspersus TaxID=1586481 RepID=A0AAV8WB70_9CUCU|nr:hypothetical protein NQ315_006666 [Exocentrus adspersus]
MVKMLQQGYSTMVTRTNDDMYRIQKNPEDQDDDCSEEPTDILSKAQSQGRDINQVCISGVGSSMIKNASSVQKNQLQAILGSAPADAISLINQLLIFNPHKRLKADEALHHDYVARFHNPDQEIIMHTNVIIPLNDDIRLAVDDYRNKLYELMSTHHQRPTIRPVFIKQKNVVPEVYSKVSKNTEKYIKSHVNLKQGYISHSEPKMNQQKTHWLHTANIRSDSKVVTQQNTTLPANHRIHSTKAGGDCKVHMKSNSEVPKRRLNPGQTNFYTSFNSYNKNHGIITQSALLELRAAGLR